MAIEDLEGVAYGPFAYRTDAEKVAEYASVVGAVSDPEWAPASFAGALLFSVTPALLADHRAGDDTRSVIHGDQSFAWHRRIPLGVELAVSGTVARVRRRSGVAFTNFVLDVTLDAQPALGGTSTFLMSGEGAGPGTGGAERDEPAALAGSVRQTSGALSDTPATVGRFAASREDLVRYAGASRDFNPIHWDHAAAVAAGLPGVVVHGLLQSAWIVEAAVALGWEPSSARFRYRRSLGAAVTAELTGSLRDGKASFDLGDADGPYVTATLG